MDMHAECKAQGHVYVTVEVGNQRLCHTTKNVIFALMCRMALTLAVYQALELNSFPQRRYGLWKIITWQKIQHFEY